MYELHIVKSSKFNFKLRVYEPTFNFSVIDTTKGDYPSGFVCVFPIFKARIRTNFEEFFPNKNITFAIQLLEESLKNYENQPDIILEVKRRLKQWQNGLVKQTNLS